MAGNGAAGNGANPGNGDGNGDEARELQVVCVTGHLNEDPVDMRSYFRRQAGRDARKRREECIRSVEVSCSCARVVTTFFYGRKLKGKPCAKCFCTTCCRWGPTREDDGSNGDDNGADGQEGGAPAGMAGS